MEDFNSHLIEKILTNVKLLVSLIENPEWLKKASSDELKNAFKLSLFIERTLEKLNEKNLLRKFETILGKWCEINHEIGDYSIKYLERSCDRLLAVAFCNSTISFNSCDLALRIYTSMLPQNRFELFLRDVLLESSSLNSINESVFKFNVDEIELEANLLFWEYKNYVKNGDFIYVKDSLGSLLSNHDLKKSLNFVFYILTIGVEDESEKQVQNIVFSKLEERLIDRSILSKDLWLFLCKNLRSTDLIVICKKFPKIIECILKFVVYIGSMMKLDHKIWSIDENISFYPEISYTDLLKILRSLCSVDSNVRKNVISKLSLLKNDYEFWQNILSDI